MRVLVTGDGAAPFSGTACYCDALRSLGHDVLIFDDAAELRAAAPPSWNRIYQRILRVPWEPARRRLVDRLVDRAEDFHADIVMVMSGLFLSADDVERLRERTGAWVILVNHDDFFSATPSNWSSLQREAIPVWDRIFVTKEVNVSEVVRRGARAEFLPFAYHPAIHRPVADDSDLRRSLSFDLVFIGTWAPERGPLFERLLERFKGSIAIFGGSWEHLSESSPVRRIVRKRYLLGDEMSMALGASKVSLGLLRKGNRDDHTQRTFEIPACRGVLLAERTPRHMSYYRDREEAVFFDPSDPNELAERLEWLVRDDGARERIRDAGYAAVVRGGHTYVNRVQQILRAYDRSREGRNE